MSDNQSDNWDTWFPKKEAMTNDDLPPLPDPFGYLSPTGMHPDFRFTQGDMPVFTADQMRNYARAALAVRGGPVAWIAPDESLRIDEGQGEPPFDDWRPLYTAPQAPNPTPTSGASMLLAAQRRIEEDFNASAAAALTLTDEEINAIANSEQCNPPTRPGWPSCFSPLLFARAVLAAARGEPKPPAPYTAEELERDNPYNAWMWEDR
jgi:hypothetical protein